MINTIFYFRDSMSPEEYSEMIQNKELSPRTLVFAKDLKAIYMGGESFGRMDQDEIVEMVKSAINGGNLDEITPDIEAVAGDHINEEGTPTVDSEIVNGKTRLTFNYLKGSQGVLGIQGPAGSKGNDGNSVTIASIQYGISNSSTVEPSSWSNSVPTLNKGTWLWVRTTYSDNNTSVTKSYIGTDGQDGSSVAVQSVTKSNGVTTIVLTDTLGHSQTLTIADGQDGNTGTPGKNGYIHFAWANSANGSIGFSTTVSEGKSYIGVYTDNTPTDSNNYGDYTWTLIKGEKGDKGDSITVSNIQYGVSESADVRPYSWQTTVPTIGKGKWLWVITTYSDNTTSTVKSYSGTDGDDGTSIAVQSVTKTNGVTTVTLTDNNGHTSTMTIADGQDGENGIDGKNGYTHFAWANSADGSVDFSTSVSTGKSYMGVYADNTLADSTDYRDYTWTLVKGEKGDPGSDATAGMTEEELQRLSELETNLGTLQETVEGIDEMTETEVNDLIDNAINTSSSLLTKIQEHGTDNVGNWSGWDNKLNTWAGNYTVATETDDETGQTTNVTFSELKRRQDVTSQNQATILQRVSAVELFVDEHETPVSLEALDALIDQSVDTNESITDIKNTYAFKKDSAVEWMVSGFESVAANGGSFATQYATDKTEINGNIDSATAAVKTAVSTDENGIVSTAVGSILASATNNNVTNMAGLVNRVDNKASVADMVASINDSTSSAHSAVKAVADSSFTTNIASFNDSLAATTNKANANETSITNLTKSGGRIAVIEQKIQAHDGKSYVETSMISDVKDNSGNITAESIADAIATSTNAQSTLSSKFVTPNAMSTEFTTRMANVATEAYANSAVATLSATVDTKLANKMDANDNTVVKKASVIASINASNESNVTIDADKINVGGIQIASDQVTGIDTLVANLISTASLNANNITSGTISADRIDLSGAGDDIAASLVAANASIGGWTVETNLLTGGSPDSTIMLSSAEDDCFVSARSSIRAGMSFNTVAAEISPADGITTWKQHGNGARQITNQISPDGSGFLAAGNLQWSSDGGLSIKADGIIINEEHSWGWNPNQSYKGLCAVNVVGDYSKLYSAAYWDYDNSEYSYTLLREDPNVESVSEDDGKLTTELASAMTASIIDASGMGIALINPIDIDRWKLSNAKKVWDDNNSNLTGKKVLALGVDLIHPTTRLVAASFPDDIGRMGIAGGTSGLCIGSSVYINGHVFSDWTMYPLGGVETSETITAGSFVKEGGTSNEVLMADGSTMTLAELKAALAAI